MNWEGQTGSRKVSFEIQEGANASLNEGNIRGNPKTQGSLEWADKESSTPRNGDWPGHILSMCASTPLTSCPYTTGKRSVPSVVLSDF